MKVIKPVRIAEYGQKYARSRKALDGWLKTAQKAKWRNFLEMRATWNSADQVAVASGRRVFVFNIGSARLITAVHFNTGHLYVLRFLTHADYDKNKWKSEL